MVTQASREDAAHMDALASLDRLMEEQGRELERLRQRHGQMALHLCRVAGTPMFERHAGVRRQLPHVANRALR